MKILILGSLGFIGKHLLDRLRSNGGNEVWGCDIADKREDRFYIQYSDSMGYIDIISLVDFDLCINCSGAASVPESMHNALRDFSLNTYNVALLLDAIRLKRPKCSFINLSSAAVYGQSSEGWISEDCDINPVSPYGFHKAMAELLCKEYYRCWGIQACSVRIFSAYGPGLRKQILWDLYEKMKVLARFELWGDGSESRDYVEIEDIVSAISLIAEKAEFIGESYNLGSGKATEVRKIVQIMSEKLGYNGEVTWKGHGRPGDPRYVCADIRKLGELGYKPTISIESGISRYVEWVRSFESV